MRYEIEATAEYENPAHLAEKETYAVPASLIRQTVDELLRGWSRPGFPDPVVTIKITPRRD